ncbi:MAG: Mth938-like domain-containing protein [Chitinophagales bacterium]|nr:Mth938-like domain-containing protein [Chitinophagales bacterium]
MNKIVKGDSFLIEHYDIKKLINFKWVEAGNVTATEYKNNQSRSIESLVDKGFWISDFINLDDLSNNLKTLLQYKIDGRNGVSWQDACLIINQLNVHYYEILSEDYFFKLPCEMQYGLFKIQHKENDLISSEAIWCRDYYMQYNNSVKVNWVGNSINSMVKTCYYKDKSDLNSQRYYLSSETVLNNLGFRIVLSDISFRFNSPKILKVEWGLLKIESLEKFKDAKIFPSGARSWNWKETGTKHESGIQKNDVIELLAQDAEIVVLSTGYKEMLKVTKECIEYLESKNIPYHILRTDFAVKKYNELVEKGIRVGALIHSTG